ncbi:MAG: rod shape-determining protein MreD [Prochlorococcaceae cyanobacterium]
MGTLHRQRWCVATALLVPLLTLASPAPLKIAAVAPAWAVLWLLPWALVDGAFSGAAAGLGLGLLLDSLALGGQLGATQIPALMLLGWWWGRLGRRGPPIERSFNLGLLALLGTLLLDFSLMVQFFLQRWPQGSRLAVSGVAADQGVDPALFASPAWLAADLGQAGLHILLAQTLLTGLLAPVLCSLQLLFWRQQIGQARS